MTAYQIITAAERMAKSIARMRVARAQAVFAAAFGHRYDGITLHNASIDTKMSGWCYRSPERLKAAKRARHIDDSQFVGSRLVEALWKRHCREYRSPAVTA